MVDGDITLNIREYPSGVLRHRHDYAQIIIPISGLMRITIENFNGLVSNNMMAVVPGFHNHEFETNQKSQFFVLDCYNSILNGTKIWTTLNNSVSRVFYLSDFLVKYFRFISNDTLVKPESFKEQKSAILSGLQMVQPNNMQPEVIPTKLTEIEAIAKRIVFNEGTIDSISKIVKDSAMGQSQFYDQFRKTTGFSPKQYRLKNILSLASEQLLISDDNVSVIANRAGYDNLTSFTRIFKKHFGISPSEYRFQCRTIAQRCNLQER